jgi:ppGpp synthetase/RelA/SpoT-type nucleotidyltranferase
LFAEVKLPTKKRQLEEFERQAFPSEYFEKAKTTFRSEYEVRLPVLKSAEKAFRNLVALLLTDKDFSEPKVISRVKDRTECVSKFDRKYRASLEKKGAEYAIIDHISDIVGLRLVCLYEDEIEKIEEVLRGEFDVIDRTDKTKEIEETISSFGYKGVHLDVKLSDNRSSLPEYAKFADLRFEIQIRTIVQDGWSEIDHKIKYKKETPDSIQRRIASLAALFEMADREFQTIRDLSFELERSVEEGTAEIDEGSDLNLRPPSPSPTASNPPPPSPPSAAPGPSRPLSHPPSPRPSRAASTPPGSPAPSRPPRPAARPSNTPAVRRSSPRRDPCGSRVRALRRSTGPSHRVAGHANGAHPPKKNEAAQPDGPVDLMSLHRSRRDAG